jgi:hypothetical protein
MKTFAFIEADHSGFITDVVVTQADTLRDAVNNVRADRYDIPELGEDEEFDVDGWWVHEATFVEAPKPDKTYVFQILFDDHDSFYAVPESVCREILANGKPSDPHMDITEKILETSEAASISSDCEVSFSYCDDDEYFNWGELKEELEAEFGA